MNMTGTNKNVSVRGVVDTTLVADMTVRDVERIDYAVQKAGSSARAGIDQKVAIAAMFVWKLIRKLRFTDDGTRLTIRQFNSVADDTRIRFIQQHIINYTAYSILLDFYDWLCDKRYMNKSAEGYWRKVERCFSEYQREHRSFMGSQMWCVFQDHMRLSVDGIRADLADLETSVRDFLIQHRRDVHEAGQMDDITVLQKASVCFILLTSMQHSFRDYFMDVIKTHGVDFSSEFRYADLGKMIRNTVWMCEKIGMRFATDKDGDTIIVGVNVNDSVRVTSTWNAIVEKLGDDRLLDDAATRALCLNPEEKRRFEEQAAREKAVREERERVIDEQRMREGIEQLGMKYNVTRL